MKIASFIFAVGIEFGSISLIAVIELLLLISPYFVKDFGRQKLESDEEIAIQGEPVIGGVFC